MITYCLFLVGIFVAISSYNLFYKAIAERRLQAGYGTVERNLEITLLENPKLQNDPFEDFLQYQARGFCGEDEDIATVSDSGW